MSSGGEYPKRFETVFRLRDGTEVFVRPLKPEDRDKLYQMYSTLSKETNYYRFLKRKRITRWIVEKWIEINYRDKMALVAIVRENHDEKIVADSRFYVDKETVQAEVAIKMGVKELYAYVNPENRRIIHITNKLGFKADWISETIEYKITLPLK